MTTTCSAFFDWASSLERISKSHSYHRTVSNPCFPLAYHLRSGSSCFRSSCLCLPHVEKADRIMHPLTNFCPHEGAFPALRRVIIVYAVEWDRERDVEWQYSTAPNYVEFNFDFVFKSGFHDGSKEAGEKVKEYIRRLFPLIDELGILELRCV